MAQSGDKTQKKLWKREHHRLYKQQYRLKKKTISLIEQERALAFTAPQTVAAVAEIENPIGQQVDVGVTAIVLETHNVDIAAGVCDVAGVEGEILAEEDIELGEAIEEGELVNDYQAWVAGRDISMNVESGDFDTEDHTDKESDSESEDEESIGQFLVKWNARHKVTREAMKDMLGGLRAHGHPELPVDPRTLLRTNLSYDIVNKCGGSYVYLSLTKPLQLAIASLKNIQVKNDTVLHLQFNIDGLPIFNSNSQTLWPILGRVMKPFSSPVFIVALYAGRKKPNNFNEFLQQFVDDLSTIKLNGLHLFSGITCKVAVDSFVCDAPARADVKRTKHVNYHQGCDKCIVEGIYTEKRRMTFNNTKASRRCDEDFDLLIQPDEYRVQDCTLRNLEVGMVSQFPIDYMHLTLLGLVRRMGRDWQDGLLNSKAFPSHVRRATINSLQAAVTNHAMKMPHEFQRQCRPIQECDSWKATEARQFLLYIGPVILKDVLDSRMYEHFKLLSMAIRCLCSPKLIDNYIDVAGVWLERFVNDYCKYYGDKCVYSVHAHCHLADDARRFGVLDNFSGFPFESFLGTLKGMVHKSHHVIQQIVRRISEREPCDFVPEYKLILKHKHKLGPEIEDQPNLLQYGAAQVGKTHVASDRRDGRDCCFKVDTHVCVVRNLLAAAQSDVLYVVYSVYEKEEPLFNSPVESTDVGISVVSELCEDVFFATFDHRWRKCARVPLDDDRDVVLELLHM